MKQFIYNTSLLAGMILFALSFFINAQAQTYCNPMNLDYGYCPIPNFAIQGKHRTTADPVIVNYKGDYYLFSTNQMGYWWSSDLRYWNFISKSFLKPYHDVYDDLCAPAAWVQGDTLLVFGSTYSDNFPIWMSTNPKANEWEEAINKFQIGGWDPDFFVDDDGKLYMYNGSSNNYPIYGIEINRKNFQPVGARKELLLLDEDRYGWQRFGEYCDNTFLDPFIEGAWMTKYDGKYYLQYGAPGTEFSGYADGVAVSDNPLNGFKHHPLPFSYKPGGFARGAGHGSTFQDNWGNYWHVSTIAISVKNNFERRLGLWPAGFDKDGNMFCNTAYGDYPYYLPDNKIENNDGLFTGWMLLNYNKPVMVSSTLGGFNANNAVDENLKTYWSAASGEKSEWLQSDLVAVCTVHAIQINYADQDAEFLGKQSGIFHQYRIFASLDGKKWNLIVDKEKNQTDVPHDYIELSNPIECRYLKIENVHIPTGKFAISGFRIFGKGTGQLPEKVENLIVLRGDSEPRNAWIKWKQSSDAQGYTIYFGLDPENLPNNIMVYGVNEYYFPGMDKDLPYYFSIEAFNENGIGERSEVEFVK